MYCVYVYMCIKIYIHIYIFYTFVSVWSVCHRYDDNFLPWTGQRRKDCVPTKFSFDRIACMNSRRKKFFPDRTILEQQLSVTFPIVRTRSIESNVNKSKRMAQTNERTNKHTNKQLSTRYWFERLENSFASSRDCDSRSRTRPVCCLLSGAVTLKYLEESQEETQNRQLRESVRCRKKCICVRRCIVKMLAQSDHLTICDPRLALTGRVIRTKKNRY